MPSESPFCFSDGIIDTKQVTKRAFDSKGTSEIPATLGIIIKILEGCN